MVKETATRQRDSHIHTTVSSKFFVFGGTDENSTLKDLHIFDTITNQWSTSITKEDGPATQEDHSAVLVGTQLFVFRGCETSHDDMKETYLNYRYILETTTF